MDENWFQLFALVVLSIPTLRGKSNNNNFALHTHTHYSVVHKSLGFEKKNILYQFIIELDMHNMIIDYTLFYNFSFDQFSDYNRPSKLGMIMFVYSVISDSSFIHI